MGDTYPNHTCKSCFQNDDRIWVLRSSAFCAPFIYGGFLENGSLEDSADVFIGVSLQVIYQPVRVSKVQDSADLG